MWQLPSRSKRPHAKERGGSKALVARGIVRYVTPGTLTEDTLLDARADNMLAW